MMTKKILATITGLIMVLGIVSACFASATQTITVKATIPSSTGMTVTVSKVVGTVFTKQTDNTMMDFGTLTLDTTNHIYTAANYFAVDIGVLNNGTWTVQHTPSSIYNRTTGNTAQSLDSHVNVSFMAQASDTSATSLGAVSYATSAKTITNTQIGTGWIRIYYGIGTGSGDNTGVTPIGQTQTAGTYQGSVTISLTP